MSQLSRSLLANDFAFVDTKTQEFVGSPGPWLSNSSIFVDAESPSLRTRRNTLWRWRCALQAHSRRRKVAIPLPSRTVSSKAATPLKSLSPRPRNAYVATPCVTNDETQKLYRGLPRIGQSRLHVLVSVTAVERIVRIPYVDIQLSNRAIGKLGSKCGPIARFRQNL